LRRLFTPRPASHAVTREPFIEQRQERAAFDTHARLPASLYQQLFAPRLDRLEGVEGGDQKTRLVSAARAAAIENLRASPGRESEQGAQKFVGCER
jgi:hypothetical protein